MRKPWTEQEIEFLRANFSRTSRDQIAIDLDRSWNSIQIKANRLGIKTEFQWTPAQVDYLVVNYQNLPNIELSKKLGFSVDRIQRKADSMKLKKLPRNRPWTLQDLDFLRLNFRHTYMPELVKILNRGPDEIRWKALKLLGSSAREVHQAVWTENETSILVENYSILELDSLLSLLNRSSIAIEFRAKALGLKPFRNRNRRTKPERLVENILNDLSIDFESGIKAKLLTGKKRRHYYLPDFLLENKLVIEVQGDYFHCNPLIYVDGPKDPRQVRGVLKDAEKQKWYAQNGYTLLEIWESECLDPFFVKCKLIDFYRSSCVRKNT